ncbi:hypothetical protein [Ilumatobacter nonamiensis]|uniref:hypothetical protein n=1 Tax=Ilumatobacter nonamiensis TaxID=467093 RepID=UPI00034DA959|nr:hypothetical protein [Ilumatobacter nonamiensis]
MSVWAALFWGAFSSAALFVGQAIARPLEPHVKTTGLLMGFGAGTMLSAVAYELVPLSSLGNGPGVAFAFLAGAVVYYVGDRLVDERGGKHRSAIDVPDQQSGGGSGAAMFLGPYWTGSPRRSSSGSGSRWAAP